MQFLVTGVAALLLSTTARVDAFETCSDVDNQALLDLYAAGAETSACAPYAEYMPIGIAAVYWPCEATDCNEVMAQVASDMPDCWYMGNNQKEMLQEAVDSCNGETPDWMIGSGSTASEASDTTVSSEASEEFYPDWSAASSADDAGISTESASTSGSEWPPTTSAPSLDGISTASPDAETTEAPAEDSTSTSTASTFAGTALCLSSISLLLVFL